MFLIRLLDDLARRDPPVFLCHFYNIYFAHTAGGRLIGAKVAQMILDSRDLAFYKVVLSLQAQCATAMVVNSPEERCLPLRQSLALSMPAAKAKARHEDDGI